MAISRSSMMRSLLSFVSYSKPVVPRPHLYLDRNVPIEEETTPDYDPKNVLPVDLGVLLNNRYRIAGKLGHGRACTVWLARDTYKWSWQSHRYVTLKVNNNTVSSWKHAEHEIAISRCLATKNKSHRGFRYIRTVLDSFPVAGPHGMHLCLAFEPLREPLWLFQQRGADDKFSSDAVKAIMRYMLKGLEYLHCECHVVHTDIKPGNVLLEFEDQTVIERYIQAEHEEPSPRKLVDGRWIYLSRNDFGPPDESFVGRLRITDFDCAVWGDDLRSKGRTIQLNEYRAPEVTLRAGWTYSVDIWNLGVMLWDLLENKPLFPHEEYNSEAHIAQIISLFGPPPQGLLSRAEGASQYFDMHGQFKWPERIASGMKLEDTLPSLKGEDKELFLDFVRSMLRWDPDERASANELLQHPWFHGQGFVI